MNRTPTRATFLVPAIVCLSVAVVMAIQLAGTLREDLYWTPAAEAPDLETARPRAEVYLDGKLLQERLADSEIRYEDSGRLVAVEDARIRFNNVDGVTRAQSLVLAATMGAGLAFLMASAMVSSRSRPEPRQAREEA